jgi:hypothetical protein
MINPIGAINEMSALFCPLPKNAAMLINPITINSAYTKYLNAELILVT